MESFAKLAFWRMISPETKRANAALAYMSDAYDYFKAHAISATQKARALPFGRDKQKQRVVARIYHLLAREAAFAPNVHHLDEFRARATARTPDRAIIDIFVMPGLVPGIHVFGATCKRDVDGRVKPGHDESY